MVHHERSPRVARQVPSLSKKRRRFTAEFKAEAVRLPASGGKPLAQIARELGINEQVLRKWKKRAQLGDGSGAVPEHFAQEGEIRREPVPGEVWVHASA